MAVKEKDWVTPVAIVGGGAAMLVGAVLLLRKPKKPEEVEEGEWAEATTVLARQEFQVVVREEGVPGLVPPKVEILDAQDITQVSATLRGRLIDTGYWSNVDVFFEFDGVVTPKVRMYEGDEGSVFTAAIAGLKANTTYRFRAGINAVGSRSAEMPTQYSSYKTFTTPAAGLLEVYKTRYYYNGSYYDEPHVINIGDVVGVQFNYRNTSGRTLEVSASLIIYSYGHTAGRIGTWWEGTMVSGDTRAIPLKFTADEISKWTAQLILKADGKVVVDTTIVIGYMPPF